MANFTGKYLKVWKVEEKSGYTFLDLGDGRKDKNGEYENCTWFSCLLLGEAAKKSFQKDDLVEVTSGQIFMEKYNDKWYPKIKIFHIQHMEGSGNNSGSGSTWGNNKPESNNFQESKGTFSNESPKPSGGFNPGNSDDPGEEIPF